MASSEQTTARKVAMWGASQVGKTTTLAAYVGKHKPRWIHRNHPDSLDTVRRFQEIWDNLQRNRLVPGTTTVGYHTLRHVDGCSVLFRDMRGSNARSTVANADDANALREADAAMLFLEWPGPRAADSWSAVDNALQELDRDHPAALVVTKCESYLTAGEFASFANDPLGSAERLGLPGDLVEVMAGFLAHFRSGAIFPLTVYGWKGSRPAHFYDEFGRLVPWHIRPALVERPFEHILGRLDLVTGEP